MSFREFVARMLPENTVVGDGVVINVKLRRKTRQLSWLDRKLTRFEVKSASLDFNSEQLFFFLRDSVYPQYGGYIGSHYCPAIK